jgi:hypothetical protein
VPNPVSQATHLPVENLCTDGEYPVQQTTRKKILRKISPLIGDQFQSAPPSYVVSLVFGGAVRRIRPASHLQFIGFIATVRHHFEETIGGRPFVIEVTWVAEKRWRAHIVRIPGVPTAMMPFYGETPDEAAAHLSQWLNRAHQQRTNTV